MKGLQLSLLLLLHKAVVVGGMASGNDFPSDAWADVEPIAVPDNDSVCAAIAYAPDFARVMGYFRAIVRSGERSQRVLDLTTLVIRGNPANYSCWYVRRQCLFEIGSDLREELSYVTNCALQHPKNYQIWYHRRAVVDKLGDGSQELEFIATILDDDSKNYHAWSNRQWVLSRFNLWDGELDYCESMILADIRNNSAWNQRWFVLERQGLLKDPAVVERELDFGFKFAKMAPNNESPFNYVRGLMRLPDFLLTSKVSQLAEEFLAELRSTPAVAAEGQGADEASKQEHLSKRNPPPLLALLVTVYIKANDLDKAVTLCGELADKFDCVRTKYWQYKAAGLAS